MTYHAYLDQKKIAHPWLMEIPAGWDFKKLKFISSVQPSNVDKKSHEGEEPVFLCNYTDVYYNEEITDDIQFMKATASLDQIRKFTLRSGDTILTKDSEDPNDIAVPAYVPQDLEGVVCGYHLAMLRPKSGVNGAFLKRVIDSKYARSEFATRANGLTRYGLGTYALKNFEVPLPSPEEQTAIANFLDRETAKIDTLIDKQEQLIKLLEEKRQAVISHAVTKGLNSDVRMKDSGVASVGLIPEHWNLTKVKYQFRNLDYKRIPLSVEERSYRKGEYPYYGASGIIDGVDDYLFDKDLVLVSEDGANLVMRSTPIAFIARGKYWVNNHAHILEPFDGVIEYWSERLEVLDIRPLVSGAAQPKLTAEALSNLVVACPPTRNERVEIAEYVGRQKKEISAAIEPAERMKALLKERRTALISAAVTGKIDVRNAV
jgi:type I restriction enzyme S subunit